MPFYHNGFWRLNREYGSNVDTRKLELQAKFVKNTETTATSYVWVRAKAKEKQSCDIRMYSIYFHFNSLIGHFYGKKNTYNIRRRTAVHEETV